MFRKARKDFTQQNITFVGGPSHGRPDVNLPARTNGKNCERMACEYASGIYVCNDADNDIIVPYATLAAYAQAVVDDPREECNWHKDHYAGGTDGQDLTWGQAFDANGWLVFGTLLLVVHDTCAWGCAPVCICACWCV